MTFRSFAKAAALAAVSVLLVTGIVKAVDCTVDLCGFSAGQATGLRDTFVDQVNTETIAGNKTLSGTTTLSGATTVSGTFDATSTFSLGGTAVSATAAELDDVTVHLTIPDMSIASTYFAVSYFAGTVTDWYCIVDDAFTTDNVITLNVNGGQPGTNGTLTQTASGSAAGDIDSAAVSGANVTLTTGQSLSIGSSGATTTIGETHCTIVVDR